MLSMPEPMLSLSMPILATYPDRMGQIQMESGWAGMPDGPDGVYRMGPGWLPTAQPNPSLLLARPLTSINQVKLRLAEPCQTVSGRVATRAGLCRASLGLVAVSA